MWSCGLVLAPSLIDLLEKTAEEAEEQKRKRIKKLTMKSFLVMTSRFKDFFVPVLFDLLHTN